ncbi:MAG: hypothetical protein LC101_10500 [Flavobacteriales bacterium]|nr:hypothetical protein [Flavobacteriales bacterium]
MKRIAVIGASGRLGQTICSAISMQLPETELLCLSRKKAALDEKFISFDPFTDDWNILNHTDILINAAGIIHESGDYAFEEVHVRLPQLIIENRHLIGNPKIIHISALGADSTHPIAFLRTKGEGDKILLKQPGCYIVRPSIVCTPNALLIQKLKTLLELSSKYLFNHPFIPADFLKTRIQPVMPVDLQELIVKLCKESPNNKLWNLVGAEELTFGWLIEQAGKARNQKINPIEIPKNLVAVVTRNFISVWFPELINYEQFQLLFKDNIADKNPVESFIGKSVQSTREFWENEFKET